MQPFDVAVFGAQFNGEDILMMRDASDLKKAVRDYYAARVSGGQACCDTSCCGSSEAGSAQACCGEPAAEVEGLVGPSLGCGSPLSDAAPQPGETVVDLGSGAGRESLVAAREVGPHGRAIGVDMTSEMIWTARENATRAGVVNAEFRLGEIEHLPVPDASADVVISNCVINLVPDKLRAFQEAFRILKPGGRLVVSDIVTGGPLPEAVRQSAAAWAGCIAGAVGRADYLTLIEQAGFRAPEVLTQADAGLGRLFSVTIRARKPQ